MLVYMTGFTFERIALAALNCRQARADAGNQSRGYHFSRQETMVLGPWIKVVGAEALKSI